MEHDLEVLVCVESLIGIYLALKHNLILVETVVWNGSRAYEREVKVASIETVWNADVLVHIWHKHLIWI